VLIDEKQMTPLVHVSGMFGSARGNIALVAPVTWHPINTNAVVVVDLAQDISPLIELSADEIRERLYSKHDELGDKLPIPLKLVHINKCPFLAIAKTLLPENAERLGIDREFCQENLEILKKNTQLIDVISEVFSPVHKFENKGNVDAMLYDGFFSDNDKRAFERIRETEPENLANLKISVLDKRFNDLFFRYRARNFPHTLSNDEQEQWAGYRQSVLIPILSDYFSNLRTFAEQYRDDEDNFKIINSLQRYAELITSHFN
jgi:exodeoxyribonuclease-1